MTDKDKLSTFPLESGEPFTVPQGQMRAFLDTPGAADRERVPFVDGVLIGDWAIAPPAGIAELPAVWTVNDATGTGAVFTTTYVLDNADSEDFAGFGRFTGPCYRVHDVAEQMPAGPQDSTISPTLGAAFQQAAAEQVGVNAELGAMVADVPPMPDEPAPPVDRRRWVPCSTCGGHGRVVDYGSTEQLRLAGHPSIVFAVCGGCLGACGMIVEQATDS